MNAIGADTEELKQIMNFGLDPDSDMSVHELDTEYFDSIGRPVYGSTDVPNGKEPEDLETPTTYFTEQEAMAYEESLRKLE